MCQANFQPVLTGFGVTPTGGLRQPEPPSEKRAKAVLLDDREPLLPQHVDACAEALAEALDSLHRPLLIADFERPFCTAYAALLKKTASHAAGLAVPEAYISIPHDFLFAAPYVPEVSFARWLARRQERLLPDLRPVAYTASLDGEGALEAASIPAIGSLLRQHPSRVFDAPTLLCRYFSYLENGKPVFVFFDDKASLARRLKALSGAGVEQVVVLSEEYGQAAEPELCVFAAECS